MGGEPSDMDFLLGLPAVLAERHWNRHAAGYYLDGNRMRAACRAIDALVARAEKAEAERDEARATLANALRMVDSKDFRAAIRAKVYKALRADGGRDA